MNIHKNARLTPRGRELIAKQVASGQTPQNGRCVKSGALSQEQADSTTRQRAVASNSSPATTTCRASW